MNAILLTLLGSLGLVALAVLLFIFTIKQQDHHHGTRLSLLPLEDDHAPMASAPAAASGGEAASATPASPLPTASKEETER